MEKFALAMGDPDKIENVKLDWFTKDMIDNFSNKQDYHMLKVSHHYTLMRDKYSEIAEKNQRS